MCYSARASLGSSWAYILVDKDKKRDKISAPKIGGKNRFLLDKLLVNLVSI